MSYCGEGVGRGRGRQGRREARDQKMHTADLLEIGCFWVSPPSPLTSSPRPTWTCWRPAHSQAPLGIRGWHMGDRFRHIAHGVLLRSGSGRPPQPSAPICTGWKAESTLGFVAEVVDGGRVGEGAGRWHLLGPELWAGEGAPTVCPPPHTQARLVSEQRSGPWSLAAGPCQQEMRCGCKPQPWEVRFPVKCRARAPSPLLASSPRASSPPWSRLPRAWPPRVGDSQQPGPLEPRVGCQQSGGASLGGLWKSKVQRGTLSTSGASKCPRLPGSLSKSLSPGCEQKPFTREGLGGLGFLFLPLVLHQNVFF